MFELGGYTIYKQLFLLTEVDRLEHPSHENDKLKNVPMVSRVRFWFLLDTRSMFVIQESA